MASVFSNVALKTFQDAFFPLPAEGDKSYVTKPVCTVDTFIRLKNHKEMSEDEIAHAFNDAINEGNLMPGYKMALSQFKYDLDDTTKEKPGGGIYKSTEALTDDRPNWHAIRLLSVIKTWDTKNDALDDSPKEASQSDETRKAVREQIIGCGELSFRYQHRTASYQLLVLGGDFRVIRWDRSGAIATERVNYLDHPDTPVDALWRFSMLTDEQQGLDPTAIRLTEGSHPTEWKLMSDMAELQDDDYLDTMEVLPDAGGGTFRYCREMFAQSIKNGRERTVLLVPDASGGYRKFLVGAPIFIARGITGRATRGYVALDMETKKLVWLKDSWRAVYLGVHPEGDVLEILNKAGVQHVPTVICHGHLGQDTQSPKHWKGPSSTPSTSAANSSEASSSGPSANANKRKRPDDEPGKDDSPLREHAHYRLVVREVCKPLSSFSSPYHLVSVIYDCVVGHSQAWAQTGILHRDVSSGNILIFPTIMQGTELGGIVIWSGVLADWELSKPYTMTNIARQDERTGTWQFMSADMLNNSGKLATIPDELESFTHVLIQNAVRYLPSTLTGTDVSRYIDEYFDFYQLVQEKWACGPLKQATITRGILVPTTADFRPIQFLGNRPETLNKPLNALIHTLLQAFRSLYAVRQYYRDQDANAAAPKKPSAEEDEDDDEDEGQALTPALLFLMRARASDKSRYTVEPLRGSDTPLPGPPKPTEAEERSAQLLQSHEPFMAAFHAELKSVKGWPRGPAQAPRDRVPPGWNPSVTANWSFVGKSAAKKRKMAREVN